MVSDEQVRHLRGLLGQDEIWVMRARWLRWLTHADPEDTTPIPDMVPDDRIAACAWLRQQRHVLHDTIEGGARAPEGWVQDLPLYRALCPHD